MITIVSSGLSLILHLAHHLAKFSSYFSKIFAAKHTFLLKADNALSSGNWDGEFCLWCGAIDIN